MFRPPKRLDLFERYLGRWVAACMVLGVPCRMLLPGGCLP
jgi:ACR3 family arsenite efflux pump ArsB